MTTLQNEFGRKKLVDRLLWMTCVRLVILTSVLLPAYLLSLTESWQSLPFAALLEVTGFGYLSSLIYLLILAATQRALVLQAYLQFVGDLLLISGLVLSSGGIASPFSMLYLIVISVAAVILRRRAGLTVAEVAWLLYASVIMLQYFGVLGEAADGRIVRIVYSLAVHLLGFLGVAFLTSFLARDVDRVERELAATSEDLAELELFHRDVIESMTSGLITTDLAGQVVSINRAGRRILKGEAEAGAQIWKVGLVDRDQWAALTEAATDREGVREEIDLTLSSGERLRVGYSVAAILGAESQLRGYLVIFQDLTPWATLQEELELKGRMAAVGELAAGLAHEIGNPLAAISGSVQMLGSRGDLQGSQKKLLEIVLHESNRLDRTIKSFLQFARPGERRPTHFDIASVLGENLELLRHSAELHAHHQLASSLEPAELYGDRDQLSQIFWNLARNALRAMPEGGTFDVSGEVDHEARVYRLSFSDSGTGMSEEEQLQLFHPFKSFSGKGVGIGMSIVYRIVEDHAGRIAVQSEPGVGTRITIDFPLPAANQRRLPYSTTDSDSPHPGPRSRRPLSGESSDSWPQ